MAGRASEGGRGFGGWTERIDGLQHGFAGHFGKRYFLLYYYATNRDSFRQGYGTALGLITYLHETRKLGRAYYTQTAPYHQGSRCGSFFRVPLCSLTLH